MSAEDALTEIATRNQLLLESVKAGKAADFLKFLKEIDANVRERLTRLSETPFTQADEKKLLKDLTVIQSNVYDQFLEELDDDFTELAIQQSAIESQTMATVFVEAEEITVSVERLKAAYLKKPMDVEGYTGERLLKGFLTDVSKKNIALVNNTITGMAARSATIDEIVRAIRGTRKGRFMDGILGKTNENVRAMVRTSYQHVTTAARVETLSQFPNILKGYRYKAVVDSRTTPICRNINSLGKVYEFGKGPVPPMHIGCRSQIVGVPRKSAAADEEKGQQIVNFPDGPGKVDADKSYYDILKDKPKNIQDAVLGPKRAKLLREGGLSSKEYAELSLNPSTFEPLSLKEMKERRPDIFEKAGL